MAYFKDFPQTAYSFGSNELPVAFTNIGTYVDIVDQVKDEISAYRYYYIQEGDRPDLLAHKLYQDQSFYWTFFLLNDNLRESGWPLTEKSLVTKVGKDHPNFVISTRDNLSGIFTLGQTVVGSQSGVTGTVSFRNLDLGQLFIENIQFGESEASGSPRFFNDEVVTSQVGNDVQSISLFSAIDEPNSIDHFLDGDGRRADINPYAEPAADLTPGTKLEKYREVNDNLKRIKVMTPEVVTQVASKFQEELRQ